MRQDRFTLNNIMKYIYGEQISQIPKSYYNKDMQKKYLDFGSSYLYACHGDRCQHIRRWIRERLIYMDTLMQYNVSTSDFITIRANHQGLVYLDLQTYVPMYLKIKWRDEANDSGTQIKRVGRGETVHFEYTMPTATDQEVIIYGGQYLKNLGDLSNLNPTTMLISNAKRLTNIIVHANNLINTDLSQCTFMQYIDISDCSSLGTGEGAQPTLNLENLKYLRKIDARNTKLTAIYTNQKGGNIKEILYPESIQQIVLSNQTFLTNIGIPYGYANILNGMEYAKDMTWETGLEGTSFDKAVLQEYSNSNNTTDRTIAYINPFNDLKANYNYSVYSNKKGSILYLYYYDKNDIYIRKELLDIRDSLKADFTTPENLAYAICWVKYESTYSTIQDVLDVRIVRQEEGNQFLYCQNLSNVSLTNCNSIEKMCFPYKEDADQFLAFKYVQSIYLKNSLNILENMNFKGFERLRIAELLSMPNLKTLGFDNMLTVGGVSTLTNIKLGDIPKVSEITFNVTSADYSITFAKDAIVDLSEANSIKKIISNYPIQGLKTIIMPITLEDLRFTNEFNVDLVCSIKNLWSPNVNHNNDEFEGIDFTDMHVKNIDMSTLKNISTALNFSIAPTDISPNFNIGRDGVTYKFFQPEGTIDLSNYIGQMTRMFEGLNLDKLEIFCSKNLIATDYSYFLSKAIFSDASAIIKLAPRMKNAINFTHAFSYTEIDNDNIKTILPIILKENAILENTFIGCNNITNLDELQIVNVKRTTNMFASCEGLISAKNMVINFNDSCASMFENCINLETIAGTTLNNITTCRQMFNNCSKLEDYFDKIPYTCRDFYRALAFTNIKNLNGFTIENSGEEADVMWGNNGYRLFEETPLERVENCYFDCDLGKYHNDITGGQPSLFREHPNLTYINIEVGSHCQSIQYLCAKTGVEYLKITGNSFTQAGGLCQEGTAKTITIDIDTRNVEGLDYAFSNCANATTIDLGDKWDLSSIKTIEGIFYGANKLLSVVPNNWNCSNLSKMNNFISSRDFEGITINNAKIDTITQGFCNNYYGKFIFNNCTFVNCTYGLAVNNTRYVDLTFNDCVFDSTVVGALIANGYYHRWHFNRCDFTAIYNFTNFASAGDKRLSFIEFNDCLWANQIIFDSAFENCISLETDFIMPNTVTSAVNCFKDCTKIISIHSNWNTIYKNSIVPTDCYKGCNGIRYIDDIEVKINEYSTCFDDIPVAWGGYGYIKEKTLICKLEIPEATTVNLLNDSNRWTDTSYTINYGDGTNTSGDPNVLSHYYEAGTYYMKAKIKIGENLSPLFASYIVEVINIPDVSSNLISAFNGCSNLIKVDASNLTRKASYNTTEMFKNCGNLENAIFPDDIALNSSEAMFKGCTSLINLSSTTNWNMKKCVCSNNMFNGCSSLEELDVSKWEMSGIDTIIGQNTGYMFTGCKKLKVLDVSKWNVGTWNSCAGIFAGCASLTSLDLRGWTKFAPGIKIQMGYLFKGCSNLTEILGLETLVTEDVIEINSMFESTSFENFDLTSWDTSNITNASNLFNNCANLKEVIGLNGKNLKKVTTLSGCFKGCSSLTSIDLSSCIFEKLTIIEAMFMECSKLTSIKLNVPSTITNQGQIIQSCFNLKSFYTYDLNILPQLTGWTYLAPYNGYNEFFYDITIDFKGELTAENSNAFYNATTYIGYNTCGILRKLSSSSLVSLFNCLKDYSNETIEETPTLKITSTNIDKLTDEEMEIAINKGWTLI